MKFRFTLLLLLFSFFAWAQKTVSGKVTDQDGAPLPSASVTVEEPGQDAILAYSITNSKGEFKVTFTSGMQNVDLKIKAFNQKTLVRSVSNSDQVLNFKMESEATEIKEVQLKTKMITAKGDTISYDLKAFDSKADRTLADVMKKIPGIEVNADGSILYQGNAINKFYVNGKDLMEGGYGTINNSLPKDAVAKVEVLENHQPIKMLKDKVPSDQAAINIKLKNSVTMTGRGEVGSGFLEPWLWNVKLTPMFFGENSQWVLNYKTNNMGEQVENEGNILSFGSGWEGRRMNASQNDWLNVENASTPNLPVKRYLINNVHYLSANYLTSPFKNKEWELKLNANYTNNTVDREDRIETTYYDPNGDVKSVVNTAVQNRFFTDKLKGEIIFTKNAKKGFFKNTTSFTQFWNADRGLVTRDNTTANEAIESPTSSFQNSLSTILPWKEKMINIKSFINYQDDQQTLEIKPANYLNFDFINTDASSIVQNFRIKDFEANHSANISFTKKGWTFTPEVGLNFNTKTMTSELLGFTDLSLRDMFSNDIKFTETIPYGSLGINFKNESWSLFANIPMNFNSITIEDLNTYRNVDKSLSKITIEPNLFAQYSFASFWKASLTGSINNTFGDINSAYAGTILLSPTNINAMDPKNPIPETNTKSVGSRIEYRNPLNNLFFNVNYRISNINNNLISSRQINDLGFISTKFTELDNDRTTNGLSAEIGKYFPKFKSNLSVSYSNQTTNSQVFLDDRLLDNKNNSQSTSLKFNNTYFSWLSLDYNMSFSWNNQRNKDIKLNENIFRTQGYNHNLAVYGYPLENHTIGFYWDQVNSINGDMHLKNGFFDLSYQYSWSKKKVDFEFKWLNIANTKVFENYTVNTSFNTASYTRVQLRPSQVMLTVKFNFK